MHGPEWPQSVRRALGTDSGAGSAWGKGLQLGHAFQHSKQKFNSASGQSSGISTKTSKGNKRGVGVTWGVAESHVTPRAGAEGTACAGAQTPAAAPG